MNRNVESKRRIRSTESQVPQHERGQIIPITLVLMITMFGVCGFVIDAGRLYLNYEQLQSSTDAAALAGGEALGVAGSNPVTAAKSYSSQSGGNNVFGDMQAVTTNATLECYTTLQSEGLPCYSDGSYNAIQVTQSVAVPMTFAKFFGATTVNISAVATAAAAGAATTPYNVAIIVDTTKSMGDTDTGSDCDGTRLSCALGGVQTLLSELYPCASQLSTCSTINGVASNAVDQVSLFTFPNMTTATVSNDTTCPTSKPDTEDVYTFPPSTLSKTMGLVNASLTVTTGSESKATTTYTPMTYDVTYGLGSNGFLSDYRASDTSSGLNASSAASIAIGSGSSKDGCTAMGDPGGAGTYYAGVIYQAANALLYEQAQSSVPTQNVIILISDGDASSSQAEMAGGSGSPGSSTYTIGTTITTLNATSGGTYPSWNNQCAQAVTAAQTAAKMGIKIYAVAYGAESSGCSTDSPAITPCQTMKDIASSPAYFFSDYAQSGTGIDATCAGSGASTTSIKEIFQDIATSFTVSRLIANNLT